ncbi:MAG: hypothetical protein M3O61_00105 [Gemmatimonadota bacterium]|nr:hypothetical protein [Gemmatimonadota bacterium]
MITRVSADRLGWLCAVFGVAAACSGGGEAPNAASASASGEPVPVAAGSVKTDNACQLLTKAEAQGVFGSPINDVGDESKPFPIGTMLRSSCFYRSDDGGTITVTLSTYENEQDAADKFARLKRMYRGARPVASLGEDAFAENEALVIKQGSRHLLIDLKPGGADKITNYSDTKQMDALLARERQVAVTALARLPAGSSTTGASAAQPALSARSACSLVTKAEMEGILGGPLTHAVATDSPAQTACTYTGAGSRYAQLTVEWQGGASGIAGANLAGALMGAAGGEVKATTPITGLGDEAVMLIGGVLNVRKGPALITVDLRMQRDYEAKGKAIAQLVIARI